MGVYLSVFVLVMTQFFLEISFFSRSLPEVDFMNINLVLDLEYHLVPYNFWEPYVPHSVVLNEQKRITPRQSYGPPSGIMYGLWNATKRLCKFFRPFEGPSTQRNGREYPSMKHSATSALPPPHSWVQIIVERRRRTSFRLGNIYEDRKKLHLNT